MRSMLLTTAAIMGLSLAGPASAQTATPATPGSSGGVATPNSGQLDGPGSPTGTGIGATDPSVLPNVGGGNGFQNNTSLNGSSSAGAPAAASPGRSPVP